MDDEAPVPVQESVAPAPETTAIVNEIDIPADGSFPAPQAELPLEAPKETVAADAPQKVEEPKVVKKSPYQARIDTLTAQREQERREKEEFKRQVDLYRAIAENKGTPDPANPDQLHVQPAAPVGLVPGSAEFQRVVRDEAVRVAAEETAKERSTKMFSAGVSEYKDFNDRCNVVASLGAGDRPDFMQIITDPTVIPDGHKVVAALGEPEHLDEAARILTLPTVQMAAALVKFQAEISKAPIQKPLSSAPTPIKPIDGQSRGSDEPNENDSMAEYARKYKALQAKKLAEKTPSRFAKH